jgi:hypothetical protein
MRTRYDQNDDNYLIFSDSFEYSAIFFKSILPRP